MAIIIPAAIPDDVLQHARAVFVAVSKIEDAVQLLRIASGELDDMPMLQISAGAILTERQRCADVAKAEADAAKDKGLAHEALGALWVRTAILKARP